MEVDDNSSDELHIDEGQDNSASNSTPFSRDLQHNAYSSNAGAYNNALLGFGGRGDTANSDPHFASIYSLHHPSSKLSTGSGAKQNSIPHVGAKPSGKFHRSGSHKKSRLSGNIQQSENYYSSVGRTSAEQSSSTLMFKGDFINMAASGSSASFAKNNMNDSFSYGPGPNNRGGQKR